MREVGCTIIVSVLCVITPGSYVLAASLCDPPLTYSIRTLDSRFGLTYQGLQRDLSAAGGVWDAVAQKKLFAYATSGGAISIDLLYDARQAETDRQKSVLSQLTVIQSSFDAIHVQFERVASTTALEQSAVAADFALYKTDESKFNAEVDASNTRGGATQSEYDAFLSREQALKVRFDAIKKRQDATNETMSRLNILAGLLNQLASALNTYVVKYNAAITKGASYQEGLYEQYNQLRTITVYQFSDEAKLTRVLTHELGHALGMQHVSDTNAILYKENSGNSLIPTESDRAELARVCGL